MLVVCKKCKVEHDSRDINSNGVCIWCERKEDNEAVKLQYDQKYFFNYFHNEFDWNLLPRYNQRTR